MGKNLFHRVCINDPEGMRDGSAGSASADPDIAARLTSFIMAWLLAILFCLAFWYGIYLLVRLFVS